MKSNQRLEYGQLAKVMAERGMVEPRALQEALDISSKGGAPFPEALVSANLVSDWELSRLVCELYNLPFLTIDMCDPNPDAMQGIDEAYLLETGLIPMGRYGHVLTVCMPGLVPAEVLGLLAAQLDLFILPVVGTVRTNRMWIENNFRTSKPDPIESPKESKAGVSTDWSDIFDAADAAVLLDLEEESASLEPLDMDDDEDDDEHVEKYESADMPDLGPAVEDSDD